MKKIFAVIAAVLFVLSFAASAFAIHAEIPSETQAVVAKGGTQITLGGELRVRGWYQDNLASELPVKSDSYAWYDQRVRLSLDATTAPGVQGYVQLESGDKDDKETKDVYVWGSQDPLGPPLGNLGGTKTTDLKILQAWIQYSGSGLLGFNSGLKIGHMPLALGDKEFFDHTKFGDDAIVFFMDPTKQLHIGLLTVKFMEDATTDNTNDLDGYVGLMTYKIDDKNTVGINYTYLNNSDTDFSHQNLGVHAKGNISGLGYKATGDIQFGESSGMDFKGYAVQLGLNYMIDAVNLRGSIAMGSGDDDSDSNIEAFIPYLGADQHYTLIYEYRVATAAGYTASGLNNTTYYNLGVDYKASKDLGLSLDGYILRATKEQVSDDKDAGWEVDAKMTYAVAKNLTYQIDAGYFDAGDMYGSDAKAVTVLRHALTLSF